MTADVAVNLSCNESPVPDHHKIVVKTVLQLTEELLEKVDVDTLEAFKALLESKVDQKQLDEKANLRHVHSLTDLPGLRKNETFLETFKSLVLALNSKALKEHSHSLRDLISIIELENFIKSVMYPGFVFNIEPKDGIVTFTAKILSTQGYNMGGASLQFKRKSCNHPNWIVLDEKIFDYAVSDYCVEHVLPDEDDNYDFEIRMLDKFNPGLSIGSKVVSYGWSPSRN